MPGIESVKEIHNFKYYTGLEPKIKAYYRAGNRPTEFGNKVWATSLVLLDYISKNSSDLKKLKVLEVGCGWGLLGVYMAKEFACQVTCADLDKSVLPIVDLHAELNSTSVETKQAAFKDFTQEFLSDFDLIVGAEVCYSEEVSKELIELIDLAMKSTVTKIMLADPGRPDFDTCLEFSLKKFNSQVLDLPGSVNGKVTKLLIVS